MIVEIGKIGQVDHRERYRIITSFDVKEERWLLSQPQVTDVIDDDDYRFEKGNDPVPNTWFLHVTRKK